MTPDQRADWDRIALESRFWAAMAKRVRRLEKWMQTAPKYNPWEGKVFEVMPEPPPCDAHWTD